MTRTIKFDAPIKADDVGQINIVHTVSQWEEVQAVIANLLARNAKLEKFAAAASRYFTEDPEGWKYLNPSYFINYTRAKLAVEALEQGE